MFNIVILRIKNQTQVHTIRCVKTRTGICNLWGGLTFSVGEKKFSNFCKTCILIRIWTNELMLPQNVFSNAPRQFSFHRTAYPRPQTNHTVSSILYLLCACHFTPRGCRRDDKCCKIGNCAKFVPLSALRWWHARCMHRANTAT